MSAKKLPLKAETIEFTYGMGSRARPFMVVLSDFSPSHGIILAVRVRSAERGAEERFPMYCADVGIAFWSKADKFNAKIGWEQAKKRLVQPEMIRGRIGEPIFAALNERLRAVVMYKIKTTYPIPSKVRKYLWTVNEFARAEPERHVEESR